MEPIWRASLARKYESNIDALHKAIRDCPNDLWETSVWAVKKDDRYVWPVRRAGSRTAPDADTQLALLQVHSAFWNVAYHTIFHLDFYLSGAVLPFRPLPPFKEDEHRRNVVPRRTYSREELLPYLAHGRAKAARVIENVTDKQLETKLPRTRGTYADLLLSTLLHVNEHTTQLNLFLSLRGFAKSLVNA